ncbi:MAG: hypothetical protein ACI30S_00585 [Muribaculaceae bacterium]
MRPHVPTIAWWKSYDSRVEVREMMVADVRPHVPTIAWWKL